MKQITKYIGLLAILPLALVALSPSLIGEAEAAIQRSVGTPNQSFGSADSPVCGGAICGESSANTEVEQTNADVVSAAEYDALNAQIGEKTLELRMANVNGDSDKVAELQDELKDLRNQIAEWKNN